MKPTEPQKRPARHKRSARPIARLALWAGSVPAMPAMQSLLSLVLLPGLSWMLLVRLPAILANHPATWHRLPPAMLQQQVTLDLGRFLAQDLLALSNAFFTLLSASLSPLSY